MDEEYTISVVVTVVHINYITYLSIYATDEGPYHSPGCFPNIFPISAILCTENGH